mgnify:CR=1 FL=1
MVDDKKNTEFQRREKTVCCPFEIQNATDDEKIQLTILARCSGRKLQKHDGDRCEPTRTLMCERCAIRRTPVCAHMEDGHRCAIGVRLIITGVRLVSVWCATEASFWEKSHRAHRFHMQQVNPKCPMRPIRRANLHKSQGANLTTCGAHQYHLPHTRRKPPRSLVSDQVEDPKKF